MGFRRALSCTPSLASQRAGTPHWGWGQPSGKAEEALLVSIWLWEHCMHPAAQGRGGREAGGSASSLPPLHHQHFLERQMVGWGGLEAAVLGQLGCL